MTPRLRPATEADREFLWRLHRAAMRPHVEAARGWNEADQRRRFDDGFNPTQLEIVLIGEEPVGMLRVEQRAEEVFLHAIEVAPDWQGRGIGARLIAEVIEQAGNKPVALQVLKANPARRLYERLGFVAEGELTVHYRMRRQPSSSKSLG